MEISTNPSMWPFPSFAKTAKKNLASYHRNWCARSTAFSSPTPCTCHLWFSNSWPNLHWKSISPDPPDLVNPEPLGWNGAAERTEGRTANEIERRRRSARGGVPLRCLLFGQSLNTKEVIVQRPPTYLVLTNEEGLNAKITLVWKQLFTYWMLSVENGNLHHSVKVRINTSFTCIDIDRPWQTCLFGFLGRVKEKQHSIANDFHTDFFQVTSPVSLTDCIILASYVFRTFMTLECVGWKPTIRYEANRVAWSCQASRVALQTPKNDSWMYTVNDITCALGLATISLMVRT